MNAPVRNKKLDLPTAFAIREELTPLLAKREDGFWTYSDGYTDGRVAMENGWNIHSVRHVRRQIFGDLRPYRNPELPLPPGGDRIETLEAEVKSIRAELDAIKAKLIWALE